MSTEKTRIETLAEALLALTYTEMMEVGRSLSESVSDDGFDTDVPGDWAGLLAAWAENNTPENSNDG